MANLEFMTDHGELEKKCLKVVATAIDNRKLAYLQISKAAVILFPGVGHCRNNCLNALIPSSPWPKTPDLRIEFRSSLVDPEISVFPVLAAILLFLGVHRISILSCSSLGKTISDLAVILPFPISTLQSIFYPSPVYNFFELAYSQQKAQLPQRNSESATHDYLGWSTDLLMITLGGSMHRIAEVVLFFDIQTL